MFIATQLGQRASAPPTGRSLEHLLTASPVLAPLRSAVNVQWAGGASSRLGPESDLLHPRPAASSRGSSSGGWSSPPRPLPPYEMRAAGPLYFPPAPPLLQMDGFGELHYQAPLTLQAPRPSSPVPPTADAAAEVQPPRDVNKVPPVANAAAEMQPPHDVDEAPPVVAGRREKRRGIVGTVFDYVAGAVRDMAAARPFTSHVVEGKFWNEVAHR